MPQNIQHFFPDLGHRQGLWECTTLTCAYNVHYLHPGIMCPETHNMLTLVYHNCSYLDYFAWFSWSFGQGLWETVIHQPHICIICTQWHHVPHTWDVYEILHHMHHNDPGNRVWEIGLTCSLGLLWLHVRRSLCRLTFAILPLVHLWQLQGGPQPSPSVASSHHVPMCWCLY